MCCYPDKQISPTYLPGVMHQSRNQRDLSSSCDTYQVYGLEQVLTFKGLRFPTIKNIHRNTYVLCFDFWFYLFVCLFL